MTTTSSQFVMWMVRLKEIEDDDLTGFHRNDYFLAQIAAEIRRGIAKNPKSVKLKDFLMKFVRKEKSAKTSDMNTSKSFWKALTGISSE